MNNINYIQPLATVAQRYYPDENKVKATRKLKNYIKRNKLLYGELQALGYDEYTTELTPRQQQVITWFFKQIDEEVLDRKLRSISMTTCKDL